MKTEEEIIEEFAKEIHQRIDIYNAQFYMDTTKVQGAVSVLIRKIAELEYKLDQIFAR